MDINNIHASPIGTRFMVPSLGPKANSCEC